MRKMPDYRQLKSDCINEKAYSKYSLEGYLDEKQFQIKEPELSLVSKLLCGNVFLLSIFLSDGFR